MNPSIQQHINQVWSKYISGPLLEGIFWLSRQVRIDSEVHLNKTKECNISPGILGVGVRSYHASTAAATSKPQASGRH